MEVRTGQERDSGTKSLRRNDKRTLPRKLRYQRPLRTVNSLFTKIGATSTNEMPPV